MQYAVETVDKIRNMRCLQIAYLSLEFYILSISRFSNFLRNHMVEQNQHLDQVHHDFFNDFTTRGFFMCLN